MVQILKFKNLQTTSKFPFHIKKSTAFSHPPTAQLNIFIFAHLNSIKRSDVEEDEK